MRIGRLKFWLGLLFVLSGAYALSTLVARNLTDAMLPAGLGTRPLQSLIAALAFALVWILGLRRLRDRDRSGLWLLPLVAGPVLMEGLALAIGGAGGNALLVDGCRFASLALAIWALLELGVMPGMPMRSAERPHHKPPARSPDDDDARQRSAGGPGAAVSSSAPNGTKSRASRHGRRSSPPVSGPE